jgi:hypothetical protein
LEEELGYSKVSVKKTTPKTSNIVFMKRWMVRYFCKKAIA